MGGTIRLRPAGYGVARIGTKIETKMRNDEDRDEDRDKDRRANLRPPN